MGARAVGEEGVLGTPKASDRGKTLSSGEPGQLLDEVQNPWVKLGQILNLFLFGSMTLSKWFNLLASVSPPVKWG